MAVNKALRCVLMFCLGILTVGALELRSSDEDEKLPSIDSYFSKRHYNTRERIESPQEMQNLLLENGGQEEIQMILDRVFEQDKETRENFKIRLEKILKLPDNTNEKTLKTSVQELMKSIDFPDGMDIFYPLEKNKEALKNYESQMYDEYKYKDNSKLKTKISNSSEISDKKGIFSQWSKFLERLEKNYHDPFNFDDPLISIPEGDDNTLMAWLWPASSTERPESDKKADSKSSTYSEDDVSAAGSILNLLNSVKKINQRLAQLTPIAALFPDSKDKNDNDGLTSVLLKPWEDFVYYKDMVKSLWGKDKGFGKLITGRENSKEKSPQTIKAVNDLKASSSNDHGAGWAPESTSLIHNELGKIIGRKINFLWTLFDYEKKKILTIKTQLIPALISVKLIHIKQIVHIIANKDILFPFRLIGIIKNAIWNAKKSFFRNLFGYGKGSGWSQPAVHPVPPISDGYVDSNPKGNYGHTQKPVYITSTPANLIGSGQHVHLAVETKSPPLNPIFKGEIGYQQNDQGSTHSDYKSTQSPNTPYILYPQVVETVSKDPNYLTLGSQKIKVIATPQSSPSSSSSNEQSSSGSAFSKFSSLLLKSALT